MIDRLREAAGRAASVVREAVEGGEVPGAAFGVAQADAGIVSCVAFGHAGPARPVTVDTPFCLASTTKPITTTVLGALLDAGTISLDDPVRSLVPELPGALIPGPEITVRSLAAHTAGIGTHHRFFYADERSPVALSEAVSSLARPVLPVGGQWRYSNLGYGVLQLALERAAGETMAALVERTVYRPLGMSASSWGELTGPPGAADRHLTTGETYPGYVTDHPAASEAWSSITDLLGFGLAHAARTHLADATHALLATPAAPRQPDGAAYGLGWVTRQHDGVVLLVHAGRMGGVSAHLVVVPSLGLVVAGLANIETDRLSEAAAGVLTAVVPGYHPPAPSGSWTVGRPHPALAARWSGSVTFDQDELPVVLNASGERVTASIAGTDAEVVMPHVQPDGVFGHLMVAIPHPLVPDGSLCHLDAVVGSLRDDGVDPAPEDDPSSADIIVGAVVAAQYPGAERRRQGDAVSGALVLHRDA